MPPAQDSRLSQKRQANYKTLNGDFFVGGVGELNDTNVTDSPEVSPHPPELLRALTRSRQVSSNMKSSIANTEANGAEAIEGSPEANTDARKPAPLRDLDDYQLGLSSLLTPLEINDYDLHQHTDTKFAGTGGQKTRPMLKPAMKRVTFPSGLDQPVAKHGKREYLVLNGHGLANPVKYWDFRNNESSDKKDDIYSFSSGGTSLFNGGRGIHEPFIPRRLQPDVEEIQVVREANTSLDEEKILGVNGGRHWELNESVRGQIAWSAVQLRFSDPDGIHQKIMDGDFDDFDFENLNVGSIDRTEPFNCRPAMHQTHPLKNGITTDQPLPATKQVPEVKKSSALRKSSEPEDAEISGITPLEDFTKLLDEAVRTGHIDHLAAPESEALEYYRASHLGNDSPQDLVLGDEQIESLVETSQDAVLGDEEFGSLIETFYGFFTDAEMIMPNISPLEEELGDAPMDLEEQNEPHFGQAVFAHPCFPVSVRASGHSSLPPKPKPKPYPNPNPNPLHPRETYQKKTFRTVSHTQQPFPAYLPQPETSPSRPEDAYDKMVIDSVGTEIAGRSQSERIGGMNNEYNHGGYGVTNSYPTQHPGTISSPTMAMPSSQFRVHRPTNMSRSIEQRRRRRNIVRPLPHPVQQGNPVQNSNNSAPNLVREYVKLNFRNDVDRDAAFAELEIGSRKDLLVETLGLTLKIMGPAGSGVRIWVLRMIQNVPGWGITNCGMC